jgi:hypothetical protein
VLIIRLHSCESELRLCFLGNEEDGDMMVVASKWHSLCDSFVTAKPTTPILTSISTPFDDEFCGSRVRGACATVSFRFGACTTLSDAAFTSCACQPDLIREDYTCEFLANSSCLGLPAATTDVALYGYCSDTFDQAIAGSPGGVSIRSLFYDSGV